MNKTYILVINCGSSSLKFALYDTHFSSLFKPLKLLTEGIAELKKQDEKSNYQAKISIIQGKDKHATNLALADNTHFHADSLNHILAQLNQLFALKDHLLGIGHRVVHGGSVFNQSVLITDKVLAQIKQCIPLAPLHNPANILGIEVLKQHFPESPQAAVFDTAFHQSIPDYAYTYAIPKQWTEDYQIRRYGFHGTSHRYVTQQAASYLEKDINDVSLITAHLGNGASVAAIKNGQSVDTSMGLTPLEGLVMGTRSGDIDPGIFDYLVNQGFSIEDINQHLNKKSGLLGVSGLSHDMRNLCEAADSGNQDASLALHVFCFRAAKYIAAMSCSLEHLDALVFTGGIGENAAVVRKMIVKHLALLGFKLNSNANDHGNLNDSLAIELHEKGSRSILIIPTDEEAMIVGDTLELIQLH
ncbi:MAG: acetate/propionate family kinase [Oleiphilus sp.]